MSAQRKGKPPARKSSNEHAKGETTAVAQVEKAADLLVSSLNNDPAMLGASPKLQLATRFLMKHHQGPLPASEDYAEYERVHEGSAGRILAMAEDSRRDAAALRARDLELDYHEAARGQWFAFILAFSAIGAGTFLGYTDHQVAGSIIGGAGLVSLVVAFIQGKRRNSN